MLEAAWWGLLGGLALVVGALVALWVPGAARHVGLVMAFGSGVLISALSFELTFEAYEVGGAWPTAAGLVLGALAFYAGDVWITMRGGGGRKSSRGEQASGVAGAIVVGTLLDGVPESMAIGISLLSGSGVSVAVVVAVFLSNVPESLSATVGLRRAGHSVPWVLRLWSLVALSAAMAAGLGYAVVGPMGPGWLAGVQAFAAGAVLTMLADTMLPEAVTESGPAVGLVVVLGFGLAFLLSQSDEPLPSPRAQAEAGLLLGSR